MNSLPPSGGRAISAGGRDRAGTIERPTTAAPRRRRLRRVARFMKRVAPLWSFGRKRILLLEDDTSMQKLVAKLLRSPRMKVELFGNGRAVVARIAEQSDRYDVLLLDLMMPHDGGLTVLRDLRDHHRSLLRKVIVMTGSGKGITDPWSPLVFAVVQKPFESSALVTAVQACARQHVSQ